jgi:hypothetical protein
MTLKFSQDLEVLLQRLSDRTLTLKEIVSETSDRGFSFIIGFISIPSLIPMPPGLTGILGTLCLLLSVQMALGRHEPWIPKSIANYQFPQALALQLLTKIKWAIAILEKLTRPRLLGFVDRPSVWRLNGLCIAWLTILLLLPIPLTNPLPTSAIILLSVATLEKDGLLMCFAYGLSIVVTLFFVLLGYVIFQAPHLIPNPF